jgi:hypothetical protein
MQNARDSVASVDDGAGEKTSKAHAQKIVVNYNKQIDID